MDPPFHLGIYASLGVIYAWVQEGYKAHGAHGGLLPTVCTRPDVTMCTFSIDVAERRVWQEGMCLSSPQEITVLSQERAPFWPTITTQKAPLHKDRRNLLTPLSLTESYSQGPRPPFNTQQSRS